MARNKRDIDRQSKQDEIVAVARRLFLQEGYEAASMARVAREAGVAANTLYWYFADKDALLIAVLNRLVMDGVAAHAGLQALPMKQQLIWLIAQFEQAHRLVMTVHARLENSPALREWHDNFHRLVEGLVVAQLTARGMTAEEARITATAGTFVVEGLLSHPQSPRQREQVLDWLVRRALGDGS
ncbi:MAG TPA: helix-turn-helix domain-containing protein [Fluviicoccus sp.]|nr:helix-turn-helix domain-containing protein [Fluviicoccus sp.]